MRAAHRFPATPSYSTRLLVRLDRTGPYELADACNIIIIIIILHVDERLSQSIHQTDILSTVTERRHAGILVLQ